MDRICSAVLDKICTLAAIGRYVIISEDEFYEAFPEDAERNESELKKVLRSLISGGFIDLKYSDGNMFCVAPLKKYVAEPEIQAVPVPANTEVEPRETQGKNVYFWAAFLGGAAGSLIISLIFAFI